MAYVDETKCPECNAQAKVSFNCTLDEGSIECSFCGFKSDLVRGDWIIEKTNTPLEFYKK